MNCPDCEEKMVESVFVEDTLEIRHYYCKGCNAFFNEREGSLEYFMTPALRKKQVNWISVDEKLPDEHDWYLVCYGGEFGTNYTHQIVQCAFYEKGVGWERNEALPVTWQMKITHFAPRPRPPKDKRRR